MKSLYNRANEMFKAKVDPLVVSESKIKDENMYKRGSTPSMRSLRPGWIENKDAAAMAERFNKTSSKSWKEVNDINKSISEFLREQMCLMDK